jgi:hypothetical protein
MSGVTEKLVREFLGRPDRDEVAAAAAVAPKAPPMDPPRQHVKMVPVRIVVARPPKSTKPAKPAHAPPVVAAKPVLRTKPVLREPADRAEQIRAAAARIAARKADEPVKKTGVPVADLASKIFTF